MRYLWIALAALVIALVAAYWFTTGGPTRREPAVWLSMHYIAHRGQWTPGPSRPENSLAAFDEAAHNGFAVELDVQLTSDGHVVVFHDDDLERMTGESGLVSETTLEELQDLHLLGGNETIPTLEEALALVGGRAPVYVEIKNRGKVGTLEEGVARQIAAYDGEAAVMSFNPFSLARVAAAQPQIPRGQLSGSLEGEGLAFYEVFLLSNLMTNWKSRPDFVAYELKDVPTLGTRLQKWRGRPLVGWTAEDDAERVAAEKTCDAVICNPQALPRVE